MPQACRPDDVALDLWVKRSLREKFAASLREPLPDCLVQLLAAEATGK